MRLSYFGKIDDEGVMRLDHKSQFLNGCMNFKGKDIMLTLEEKKNRRTNQQNAYLWGIVYKVALDGFIELGNEGLTVDDIHDFFKEKFLPRDKVIVINSTGEVIPVAISTKALSSEGMRTYIEKIARWCATYLNLIIPLPNPTWQIPQQQ
jgi:hypothetical protein